MANMVDEARRGKWGKARSGPARGRARVASIKPLISEGLETCGGGMGGLEAALTLVGAVADEILTWGEAAGFGQR
ncbi:hypothetical protein CLOM_g24206 [Closterium sp. NIES-68]|nr:hypothetical protein CLOM_g24206 [Closterium sp. NIES-68]